MPVKSRPSPTPSSEMDRSAASSPPSAPSPWAAPRSPPSGDDHLSWAGNW